MLVRAATAALILALLTLLASAVAWPEASVDDVPARPALLPAFEDERSALVTVDVGKLYAGREELLDPSTTLPTWHRHARAEAALVYEATRTCPPQPLRAPLGDVALAKAYTWFERTCHGGPPPEEMLATPPFVHPSGKSYAALAIAKAGDGAHALATRSWTKLHVLELADSGADGDEARALALLGSREWLGLVRGDRFVLVKDRVVVADRGALGLTKLRFYERSTWERTYAPLVLVPRAKAPCARPATSLLCWDAPPSRLSAAWRRRVTGVAAAIATASAVLLGIVFARERRRAALDRLHVMRTLTHELRTPAMALGLDIEPLRAAYDELPAHLQEPLLRMSAGVARLHRVIHHSARTLALFEGKGKLASPEKVDSAHELLRDLAAEWPDGVTLACEGDDGPIATDPEWLAVALRNLVENACRHGEPPVVVRVRRGRDALVVRVEDAGSTPAIGPRDLPRSKTGGGLGLGLQLVVRIAEALGGTLTHEPRPTAFVLRIPVEGA